jgi:adenylate cyclase, class 2
MKPMKPSHSNREIEIKLPVSDLSAILRKLKRLKARTIVPRTHEFNTLYDDSKERLRSQGRLLRVRINHPALNSRLNRAPKRGNRAGSAILTYKGPNPSNRIGSNRPARSRFKIKEEVEVELCNMPGDPGEAASQMERILRALGLRPAFEYEKFRTTFVLIGVRGVKVELDETPVGSFLELEGTETAIDRAAKRLGYSRQDYSTKSYGALYIEFCRTHGIHPRNMLFATTKKLR